MSRLHTLISVLLTTLVLLSACREQQISDDPTLRLSFSTDTLAFDTVFSTIGSSTKRMMIYNRNKNALLIRSVSHQSPFFHINLDGENREDLLHDITLNGGDSLFLFVRVNVDPQDVNSPVLIEDPLLFTVNGHTDTVLMQAYGQNVEIIRSAKGRTEYGSHFFRNTKPYLIYDTIVIGGTTLLEAGATLYMHSGANIVCYGSFKAEGTPTDPIRIQGDRTDRLFENVPYAHASGQWGGIYLYHTADMPVPAYRFCHTEILSGTIGIYCVNETPYDRPAFSMYNSRIHNHAAYGIVLQNVDDTIANSEISNCAGYCVYLQGGEHVLIHNTIAGFFGYPYTNLNIHNTSPQDVAALFVNDMSKSTAPNSLTLLNSIVTGRRDNSFVVATPLPAAFSGDVRHNYLKADTLHQAWCSDNQYAQKEDTVFRNIYYLYQEYKYYDFHLSEHSPAIGIADTLAALLLPYDRDENPRDLPADAGCYQLIVDN